MLSKEDKIEAISLAKKSLFHYLSENYEIDLSPNDFPNISPDSDFFKAMGCFVTLKDSTSNLRGCIGTIISDDPLYLNITRNAVSAGTRDPRFPPVSQQEAEELKFEISVMKPLVRVEDINTIEVGVHGLVMKKGIFQGLLLPQVPVELRWSKKRFLEETCGKAGLARNAYLSPETEIYSFTAEVFSEEELNK